MLIKASGVALLAIYALRRGPGKDARLLALALALGALGDALIQIDLLYGGAAFFAAHIAAITLYLRNPRAAPVQSQKLAGVALLIGTPLACWLLSGNVQIAGYGVALGGMAAGAWLSRFSRYHVGLGALLFVISDLLIFAREGPLAWQTVPDLLVWPLYYIGQFMIATGVVQTLRADHEA